MEATDEKDREREMRYGYAFLVIGIALLAAVIVWLYNQTPSSNTMTTSSTLTAQVQSWFDEYNTGLTAHDCVTNAYGGALCIAESQVKFPEKNAPKNIYALAPVFVYTENNTLTIVKLDPMPKKPAVMRLSVPKELNSILSKITILPHTFMFCTEAPTKTHFSCYIPTSAAPLGKAELYFAPLMDFSKDGNTWVVKVHV